MNGNMIVIMILSPIALWIGWAIGELIIRESERRKMIGKRNKHNKRL